MSSAAGDERGQLAGSAVTSVLGQLPVGTA